ncbi:MAG TPA: hypothetical protein VK077_08845 [Virgibacillus sp.]|nr:hypothetical protein [Virgibacillus sp.]
MDHIDFLKPNRIENFCYTKSAIILPIRSRTVANVGQSSITLDRSAAIVDRLYAIVDRLAAVLDRSTTAFDRSATHVER